MIFDFQIFRFSIFDFVISHLQTGFVKDEVKCIGVPDDLSFVAVSGSTNTKLYFYDVRSKQRQQRKVRKIKVAPAPRNKAEQKLLCSGEERALEVKDGGAFINYEMKLSRDGSLVGVGSFAKDLRVWRVRYVKPGKRDAIQERRFGGATLLCSLLKAHAKSITTVTFSACSRWMVSASLDGVVKVCVLISSRSFYN